MYQIVHICEQHIRNIHVKHVKPCAAGESLKLIRLKAFFITKIGNEIKNVIQ